MGDARRARLTLIKGGKADEAAKVQTPSPKLVQITTLIPKEMAEHIEDLWKYVGHRFADHNDFNVELYASGLKVAAVALQEAIAQKQAAGTIEAAERVATNPNYEMKKPKWTYKGSSYDAAASPASSNFGNEAAPDAHCVTAPDGACVSTEPCMHTKEPPHAEG